MAGSLLDFFDRFEIKALDRFENKLFALSIFDALSPGAERVDANSNSNKPDTWWKKLFFPRKNHEKKRYSLIYAPVRWLLGESKAELFDIIKINHQTDTSQRLGAFTKPQYQRFSQINSPLYALRENFVIGHGPKRGKINALAFLNPFNWFRALDNLFINYGLSMLAEQLFKLPQFTENNFTRVVFGLAGLVLCTVGAILRLPRVITQYVAGATVKPIWNCIKYDLTHKEAGQATPWWGWLLAVTLTAVNVVLIGLTLGGAAPVVAHLSNAASKLTIDLAGSASTLIVAPVNEVVIEPAATVINEAIKLPIPDLYLRWFPETGAILASILCAAPADCVTKPLCTAYPGQGNDRNKGLTMTVLNHEGENKEESINNSVPDYRLKIFNKLSKT